MDRYSIVKRIGDGSQGEAFLAKKNDKTAAFVVLKRLPTDKLSSSEMSVMLKMNHPNIIKCKEAFLHENSLYLVLQYAEGGDLAQLLKSQKPSQEVLLRYFLQCCKALQYCHENRVLHRDVKMENIFLSKDLKTAYLGDFGVAKEFGADAVATTFVGSPLSLSPEVLSGTPYSYMSDIWSLGCLLYELVCNKKPFAADNFAVLVNRVCSGQYEPIPADVAPPIASLISGMLNIDVSERLELPEVTEGVEMFLSSISSEAAQQSTSPVDEEMSCQSWVKAKEHEFRAIQRYLDKFRAEDELRVQNRNVGRQTPQGEQGGNEKVTAPPKEKSAGCPKTPEVAVGRAKRRIPSPAKKEGWKDKMPVKQPAKKRCQTPPTPAGKQEKHRRTNSEDIDLRERNAAELKKRMAVGRAKVKAEGQKEHVELFVPSERPTRSAPTAHAPTDLVSPSEKDNKEAPSAVPAPAPKKVSDQHREELRALMREQRAQVKNQAQPTDLAVEIHLPSNLKNLPQNKLS